MHNRKKRLVVVQIWGLGDLIMTIPVIAELARRYPNAELSAIVRGKPQEALLGGCDLTIDIIGMPPRTQVFALLRFFFQIRRRGFDMAYIGTRTLPLLALALRVFSGVRTIVGDSERFGFLYTHHRPIYPNEHRVTRMLDTLSLWDGAKCTKPHFPLVIPKVAGADAITRLRDAGLKPGEFLVIHPGSGRGLGYRQKRLPPAMIYSLIDEIRRDFPNHGVALIFGPDDMDLLSAFAKLPVGAAALSGMPFDTTKAVLSMSLAFVGGDTALGHVAAALEIPTFTVAGPTRIDESRPYGVESIVIKRKDPLACQPCWNTPLQGHCPYDTACITGMPIEFVYAPLRNQLCKTARAAETDDYLTHKKL